MDDNEWEVLQNDMSSFAALIDRMETVRAGGAHVTVVDEACDPLWGAPEGCGRDTPLMAGEEWTPASTSLHVSGDEGSPTTCCTCTTPLYVQRAASSGGSIWEPKPTMHKGVSTEALSASACGPPPGSTQGKTPAWAATSVVSVAFSTGVAMATGALAKTTPWVKAHLPTILAGTAAAATVGVLVLASRRGGSGSPPPSRSAVGAVLGAAALASQAVLASAAQQGPASGSAGGGGRTQLLFAEQLIRAMEAVFKGTAKGGLS